MASQFPCPACGFLVFGEPPGSYDFCDVCKWEDDPVQLKYPQMGGGANKESLVAWQRAALQRYPLELRSSGEYLRDPEWRPFTDDDATAAEDGPRSGLDYFHAAADEAPPYYWQRRRGG